MDHVRQNNKVGQIRGEEVHGEFSTLFALNKLQHPNSVQYYDKLIVKDARRLYIIMEYC